MLIDAHFDHDPEQQVVLLTAHGHDGRADVVDGQEHVPACVFHFRELLSDKIVKPSCVCERVGMVTSI